MLQVSTTAAHKVNTLGTELGHGRLATHLELSLLDVDHHLSTSQTTLMTRITANTYTLVTVAPLHTPTYPLFTKSNTSEKLYELKRKRQQTIPRSVVLDLQPLPTNTSI